jgi:hypothetical protein
MSFMQYSRVSLNITHNHRDFTSTHGTIIKDIKNDFLTPKLLFKIIGGHR